jgi:C4-dicarboxylate-specific signal transduction histidine kinase
VVVALVLIAGMWLWKTIEISRLSKQAETERKALKIEATSQIMQAHEAHLILLAKPLIWALRTEMLQGNLSQANLYLNDLVKEKGIQRIVIADPIGTIIASTNKKDEGQPLPALEIKES